MAYETLEQLIQKLWESRGMTVVTETVRSLGNGRTEWVIVAEQRSS